jgi:hypothetical protein
MVEDCSIGWVLTSLLSLDSSLSDACIVLPSALLIAAFEKHTVLSYVMSDPYCQIVYSNSSCWYMGWQRKKMGALVAVG